MKFLIQFPVIDKESQLKDLRQTIIPNIVLLIFQILVYPHIEIRRE